MPGEFSSDSAPQFGTTAKFREKKRFADRKA